MEIGYEEYQQLIQENPRPHFWMFGGMLLEVPEEVHVEMNRKRSRRILIVWDIKRLMSNILKYGCNIKKKYLAVCEILEVGSYIFKVN